MPCYWSKNGTDAGILHATCVLSPGFVCLGKKCKGPFQKRLNPLPGWLARFSSGVRSLGAADKIWQKEWGTKGEGGKKKEEGRKRKEALSWIFHENPETDRKYAPTDPKTNRRGREAAGWRRRPLRQKSHQRWKHFDNLWIFPNCFTASSSSAWFQTMLHWRLYTRVFSALLFLCVLLRR